MWCDAKTWTASKASLRPGRRTLLALFPISWNPVMADTSRPPTWSIDALSSSRLGDSTSDLVVLSSRTLILPSPRKVLASTRRQRWIPLMALKHEGRYWNDVRQTVRPLTSVDVDVLLGLLAFLAVPRASGLSRAALLLSGASGLRRGFGSARLSDARGSELVARAALS